MATIEAAARDFLRTAALGAAIGLLLASALAIASARPLAVTLRRVAATAEEIAERDLPALARLASALAAGDLTQDVAVSARRVDVSSKDELGAMAHSFNRMLDGLHETAAAFDATRTGLRELVGQIQTSADHLGTTAEQLKGLVARFDLGLSTFTEKVRPLRPAA